MAFFMPYTNVLLVYGDCGFRVAFPLTAPKNRPQWGNFPDCRGNYRGNFSGCWVTFCGHFPIARVTIGVTPPDSEGNFPDSRGNYWGDTMAAESGKIRSSCRRCSPHAPRQKKASSSSIMRTERSHSGMKTSTFSSMECAVLALRG